MSAIIGTQPNLKPTHELRIASTALTILKARSPVARREGYAFESAMCQIESQSPSIRPVTDASTVSPTAEVASYPTQALVTRIQFLKELLEGVRGTFDEEDRLVLHETAVRITGELIGALTPDTSRPTIDPTDGRFERLVAADGLTQARMLADSIVSRIASERLLDNRLAA